MPNELPGQFALAWRISARSSAATAKPGTKNNEARTITATGEPFIAPPRSAPGGRRRKEPRMPVEVAGSVGTPVRFVARRVNDFRPGRARPFIVRIDISEID